MRPWSRRDFVRAAGAGALGVSTSRALALEADAGGRADPLVYIGTYTGSGSEGIYLCRMDARSGALEVLDATGGLVNPSFLAVAPGRRHLYAVNEAGEFQGRPGGAVSALAIDPSSGRLTLLNHQSSQGSGPCYVSVERSGRFVLVANYGSGSAAALPIREDGSLGEASQVAQYEGSGPNAKRQDGPHAHCAIMDPENRHALVTDLGTDRVRVYRFDPDGGEFTPAPEPEVRVTPGAGPRHLAFHPDGRTLYLINELSNSITTYAYDAPRGALHARQTVPTLPEEFTGENTTADIHVHPSGRFVYGSNRGHDSIAVFAVDAGSGELALVEHVPTRGSTPRNFSLDASGRFLLVANQRSNNIVSFAVDPASGRLTPTGAVVEIPSPVCVCFPDWTPGR